MMNGSCGLESNSISTAPKAAFVAPAKRMSLYRKWNMHQMSGCTECVTFGRFFDGDRLAINDSQCKWKCCFFFVEFLNTEKNE